MTDRIVYDMATPVGYSTGTLPVGNRSYFPWDLSERNPKFNWGGATLIYSQMRVDPQIDAVLRAAILTILKVDWRLDPAGADEVLTMAYADDLGIPVMGAETSETRAAATVSLRRHLEEALEALVYGFMPFEKVVRVEGDLVRLDGLYVRHPTSLTRVVTDGQGKLLEVYQAGAEMMTGDRMCWYRVGGLGAVPQGVSFLRSSYKPWFLKDRAERVTMIAVERNGVGVPHFHLHTNASEEDRKKALESGKRFRAGDEAAIVTVGDDTFEMRGVEGKLADTLAVMQYLDRQIAKAALEMFIELGSSSTGSHALGEVQIDLFRDSCQALANSFADQFTEQVLRPLTAWSRGPEAPYPRLVPGIIGEDNNLNPALMAIMTNAGLLTPDRGLEVHVRQTFGLPEMEDPEEHTGVPTGGPVPLRPPPVQSDTPGAANFSRGDAPPFVTAPRLITAGGATERRPEGQSGADATATVASTHTHAVRTAIVNTYPDPGQIATSASTGFDPNAGSSQDSIATAIQNGQSSSGLDALETAIAAIYTTAGHYGAVAAATETGSSAVTSGDRLQSLHDQLAARVGGIDATTRGRMAGALYDGLSAGLGPDALAASLSNVLGDAPRASTIANTEARFAYIGAKLDTYAAASVAQYHWDNGAHCSVCSASQAVSPVSRISDFPTGPPPVHPNCTCDVFATAPANPGTGAPPDGQS